MEKSGGKFTPLESYFLLVFWSQGGNQEDLFYSLDLMGELFIGGSLYSNETVKIAAHGAVRGV